jgi:hypothetical protein
MDFVLSRVSVSSLNCQQQLAQPRARGQSFILEFLTTKCACSRSTPLPLKREEDLSIKRLVSRPNGKRPVEFETSDSVDEPETKAKHALLVTMLLAKGGDMTSEFTAWQSMKTQLNMKRATQRPE